MKGNDMKLLWGKEFKIVKLGLAEEEVVAFVTNLIKQRDSLQEQQQHLHSLQKLAETTVIEANELAESIKREAHGEAAKVVEEAEKRAREITGEAQRQAEVETQEEVARILEEARQEATSIMETAMKRVSSEIKNIRDTFLTSLENLVAEISPAGKEMEKAKGEVVEEGELEASVLTSPILEVDGGNEKELKTKANLESQPVAVVAAVTKTAGKTAAVDPMNQSIPAPLPDDDSILFEGEAKIGVVPPVGLTQLSRLREKLESVSHLKILAVDGYWNDGCIITILMNRPLPLIHILRRTAEVEKANFWLDGPKWSDGYFPGWMSAEPRPGGVKGNQLVVRLRRDLI